MLNTKQKNMCVSRPRRFGKSMAADMLIAYYSKGCRSAELFQGLKAEKTESFGKHLNQHNVIRLDVQQFLESQQDLKTFIAEMEKAVVEELTELFPDCQKIHSDTRLKTALNKIFNHTRKGFIFIIDEWDCVFRFAKERGDIQKTYLDFLRGLFKGAEYVELAYMTGILPIKKYGTQSAMTDFVEYTMTSPKKLSKYTGFTESEVKSLCEIYHMDLAETKKWYDGYSFQGTGSIYNPNAIIQAVKNGEFGTYWTETETYESLKVYIDMDLGGLKQAIVAMLSGEHYPIDIRTFQNDMTSIDSKDDVLTLLVHLGYLAYEISTESVYIPNEEVRQEFIRAVKYGRHREIAELIIASDKLLRDTLAMNAELVAEGIERAHSSLTAPTFYNNEQALRSIIRFAYISSIEEYSEIQELPSGIGYADVVYLPKKDSVLPVMIIELKWNKSAEGAIRQIKEKKYPRVLEGYGGEILIVGINYDERTKRHECVIEKYCK